MNKLQQFLQFLNHLADFLASILLFIILLGVILGLIWWACGDYYQGQWEFFNDYHKNRPK